ncbi:hypothetical protein BKG95_01440 [Rodentibacter pneumotropicus]|uniref:NirD/YgiW/YdeI family stress tolerance protein n=1 Tax=Rodentibacter pneumotropicus TaxID=758 RepID=A0AAW5L9W5_9PAST|nr:NirD/YgiW/YdeI family stress tolerance protein [Rodentibacter pneumotropicus]OOF68953.1 hypothetical protein BKG95_01440 [Rodentibacter pneumotropicus]
MHFNKLVLSTHLPIAASTTFAGFNGSTDRFKLGNSASYLSKTGIIGIGNDDYLFTDDGSAQIKDRIWNGLNVGPQNKIRISGKLDNKVFEKADVDIVLRKLINH